MRPYILLFLIGVIIAPAAAYVPDTLTVTFLDIGNADSILVQAPNGHAMLVDAGVPRDASTVTVALARAKVSRLEYVVATHGDNDHIGGMVGVLPHVAVGQFVNNGITVENKQGEDLASYLSAHAIPVRAVTAGDTLDLDAANVTVTVLNPQADPGTDWNEASVVLRLVFGSESFLLTGDAGTIAEGQILASGRPVASTVLKVGHHGLGTSTGAAFVGAVDPAVAVISQAKSFVNRSREVAQRLQANGAAVYSTASSGTVRVAATRTGYTVETEDGPALPLIVPTPNPTTVAAPSPVQAPVGLQPIEAISRVTVQPVPVAVPATPLPTQPTPVSGKRYAVGNPGSFIGARSGGSGSPTWSGAPQTAIAPSVPGINGSRVAGISPLNNHFVRRYPAEIMKASAA